MKIQKLINAERHGSETVAIAEQFTQAVKALEAFEAQETSVKPETLEATELLATWRELEAEVERLRDALLRSLQ